MKKLMMTVALVLAAGAAQANPLVGTWKTAPDDNGNFGHHLYDAAVAAVDAASILTSSPAADIQLLDSGQLAVCA